ncbi:MAG TPA: methyltransferase domain-containing protein [Jatrophihabitans sp.]|nr:methyltransferase domain-containing protein [Jatrophihabitans sp.]
MSTEAHGRTDQPEHDQRSVPPGIAPLLWARLAPAWRRPAGATPATVLDCGGGSGSLAVPLAAAGAELTVVDVSIDALSTLLRRAAEAGVSDRVRAVQGEVEALSELVPAGGYDLVLAHGLLENVQDRGLALRELALMLKPDGAISLLLANPVAAVLGRLLAGDVAAALNTFRRAQAAADSTEAVVRQCRQAGLTVQSIEGVGVFGEFVAGVVLERPGVPSLLTELEQAASALPPYRDIAARLHLMARRGADSG